MGQGGATLRNNKASSEATLNATCLRRSMFIAEGYLDDGRSPCGSHQRVSVPDGRMALPYTLSKCARSQVQFSWLSLRAAMGCKERF